MVRKRSDGEGRSNGDASAVNRRLQGVLEGYRRMFRRPAKEVPQTAQNAQARGVTCHNTIIAQPLRGPRTAPLGVGVCGGGYVSVTA